MADAVPLRGEPDPLLPDDTEQEVRQRPRIGKDDFEWVFIGHYYDGPLGGLLRYRGEVCYFHVVWPRQDADEPEQLARGQPRTLGVFRLTDEQLAEERHWQRLFEQHVGTHWSCETEAAAPTSTGKLHLFYDPASKREPLDLRSAEILGWIET